MFVYIALPDPSTQLRLLSFQPSLSNTPLSCQLRTYNIAACPAYYAISYCYGDPTMLEPVLVNGQATTVNRNAWLALQQVRAQAQGGLFWIDSLCINQGDLKEKSVQVHKIAAIFTGAAEVWACFRAVNDKIDLLVRTLSRFPPQDASQVQNASIADRIEEVQRRTLPWLVSLNSEFGQFADALVELGRQPFFSRMWIYQEIFLAPKVRILSGAEAADMQSLKDITAVCTELTMRMRPGQEYDYKDYQFRLMDMLVDANLFRGGRTTSTERDLSSLRLLVNQLRPNDGASKTIDFGASGGIAAIQESSMHLQCQDARDRIFSILSVFGASCSILPDYEIPAFELALKVLMEYGGCENDRRCVELTASLAANLRLDGNVAEVQDALARNHAIDIVHSNLQRTISDPAALHQNMPFACQVLTDGTGQMTAPFIAERQQSTSSPFDSSKTLLVGQRPVASATCEFAAGDWIFPISHYISDYYSSDCLGLVVRRREADVYSIVGEAAFFPHCRPCVAWDTCGCQFGSQSHADYATHFDIAFNREELLLLSIRLRQPFEKMRKESHESWRSEVALPAGPNMKWESTFATRDRRREPTFYPPKTRPSAQDGKRLLDQE